MRKQKINILKSNNSSNNLTIVSTILGNQGVAEYFQKIFKVSAVINNIQIPCMALRSNAGLPVFSWEFQ
jgi:hypothetical protein